MKGETGHPARIGRGRRDTEVEETCVGVRSGNGRRRYYPAVARGGSGAYDNAGGVSAQRGRETARGGVTAGDYQENTRLPPLVLALMRVVLVVLCNPKHQRASQTDRIRIRTQVHYHKQRPQIRPSTGPALAFLSLKKPILSPRIAGVARLRGGRSEGRRGGRSRWGSRTGGSQRTTSETRLERKGKGRTTSFEVAIFGGTSPPRERRMSEPCIEERCMRAFGGRFRGDPVVSLASSESHSSGRPVRVDDNLNPAATLYRSRLTRSSLAFLTSQALTVLRPSHPYPPHQGEFAGVSFIPSLTTVEGNQANREDSKVW
ncbi:hypothetical protein DFH09DRAFT_1096744 [Mycena vulgaris]|nr:hypothetical protein DFH09DRAFT_1096744 [Mycena vulgaris]